MRIVAFLLSVAVGVGLIFLLPTFGFSVVYFPGSLVDILQGNGDERIVHNLFASACGVLLFSGLFWVEMHLLNRATGLKKVPPPQARSWR